MRLGNLYATRNIEDSMQNNEKFRKDVNSAIGKFLRNDWGETCPEDSILNNLAITTNERIVAAYETCLGRIWIISEYGRTSTTVLYPTEY